MRIKAVCSQTIKKEIILCMRTKEPVSIAVAAQTKLSYRNLLDDQFGIALIVKREND
jgi:hypothetical protein